MKLDIGCGKNKRPGFTGIDALPFEGVDIVHDVRNYPWPIEAGVVQEVFCSNFLEHLTGEERVPFFNELHRVMAVGARAEFVGPHWSHDAAYGDPTHKWPPVSGWTFIYLNKEWREREAPHVQYTCDFDWSTAGGWDQWLQTRNDEFKVFAMGHYTNSQRTIIAHLTKRG